ncbi:DUF6541 family protein [Microbacterium sp.]|uniref:DUF6541 family protein n=1 Tax=Microbacterium sp. TaxID=51671 RepID=UPI003F962E10
MEHLQDWATTIPVLVALLAIVYLPGLLVLRLADVRRTLAVGLAPAVTCGLIGVGGIVLDLLGVPWNLLTFLCTTLAASVLVLGYRMLLRRSGQADQPMGGALATSRWTARQRIAVVGAVLLAVLFHWVPVLVIVDPYFPSALSDPMFHYNGINAVLHTGNASMFGAMDFNYGLRVLNVTYPSVWHALAALVAVPSAVVGVAHVFAYLLTPVVFLVGMACLGAEVFPRRRLMAVLTPLIAAGFVAFPDYMTVGKGFWPNALAMALFPGLLAVLVAVVLDIARGRLDQNLVRYIGSVLILLSGTAGLVLAHPTFLFTSLWVGAPVFIVVLARLLRRLWRTWSRRRFIATVGLAATVTGTVLVGMLTHPQVQSAMSRAAIGEWKAPLGRLASAVVLWPASPNLWVLAALTVFYGSVTVVGVMLAARSWQARWVFAAWVMQTLLILGVYFPIPIISQVSGLWYFDVYRLFAVQMVFVSLLFSIAFAMLWPPQQTPAAEGETSAEWPRSLATLQRRAGRPLVRIAIAGFIIVHLALGAFMARHSAYDPAAPEIGAQAVIGSEGELGLLESMDEVVPEGSLVLGDSLSGVGYAPALSDVDSVFTQVTTRSLDRDGVYLAESFAAIHDDALVCDIVRHYGITHYYEDDPLTYEGEQRDAELPGLHDVDTSTGFTEVASAGSATLWRIDACGQIDTSHDWWDDEWRRGAVVDELGTS